MAAAVAGGKRDMAAAMHATFSMLSVGRKLEARAATREAVVAQVRVLAGHLGVPLDALNVVHIAGTKGKGSTAAMCESMLRCAGYSTGTAARGSAVIGSFSAPARRRRPVHVAAPGEHAGALPLEWEAH